MSEQQHEHEPDAGDAGEQELEQQPAAGEPDEAAAGDDGDGDAELEARLGQELDDLHDDVDDDDGDRGAQPPAQPSEKEVEETYKKLDAETARHVKRIAQLIGDDAFAFLVPCELCDPSMPGFRWPREPADEVKVAVRMAIGDRQPENWQPDQYSRKCEACEGLGEVVTGSQVRGQQTLPCMTCEARGWVPIGDERRAGGARLAVLPTRPDVEQPAVPVVTDDPPEVAALKAAGYVVIRPTTVE